jgi:hypothetical protein
MKSKNLRVPYGLSVHGNEEIKAVTKVLKSSTQMGKNVSTFEKKIAKLFSKKYGLMVNSGSSALLLAMETLDIPEGSEIITPGMNRKYRSDGNGRDYFVCLQNKLGREFNVNGLSHGFQAGKLRREIGTTARSYSPLFHTHYSHSRRLRPKDVTPNAFTFQIACPLHASTSEGQLQTSLRLSAPRNPPKTTFRPNRTDSFGRPMTAMQSTGLSQSSPDLVLGLRTQTR